MEILDTLGKKITEVVKQVEEKSEEFIEIGRLNIEIIKEEEGIKKLYRKIGEITYEGFVEETNKEKEIEDLCISIKKRKMKIKELQSSIEELKKKEESGTCPVCGSEINNKEEQDSF